VTDPAADRAADGPIDDTASLVQVAGSQAASGLPQGLVAVVVVYVGFRVIGLVGRLFGRRSRR
jgi:hypothetical protein